MIFGIHTVLSAMRNGPGDVLELWVDDSRRDGRIDELIKTAADAGLAVNFVSGKTLRRLAGRERHQGVVARYRSKQALGDDDLPMLLAVAGDQQ